MLPTKPPHNRLGSEPTLVETLVIGAGAIGSFVAARLHRAGNEVTLLARGRRLDQLRREGLRIASASGFETVQIPALEWDQLEGWPRQSIICTKTCDLPHVLDRLRILPGASGRIVTLQNGVEAPDQAARSLSDSTILAGRVHGFFELREGTVRHVGVDPDILLGRTAGPDERAVDQVVQQLKAAGIASAVAQDIRVELWRKLLLAASLGGVASYLRIPAGSVMLSPCSAAMLRRAMAEVSALARVSGIDLPSDCVDRTLIFTAKFPPDATTSLQRDLMAGRTSEYDALVGAVVRLARSRNVPVPTFLEIDRALFSAGFGNRT